MKPKARQLIRKIATVTIIALLLMGTIPLSLFLGRINHPARRDTAIPSSQIHNQQMEIETLADSIARIEKDIETGNQFENMENSEEAQIKDILNKLKEIENNSGEAFYPIEGKRQQWTGRLKELDAEKLSGESQREESLFFEYQSEEQIDKAIWHLKRAIAFQEKINNDFSDTPFRNYPRVIRMQHELENLTMSPLYELVHNAEMRAKEAQEAGQWEDAENQWKFAIQNLEKLIDDYRESPYADVFYLKQLKAGYENMKAARVSDRIEVLFDKATRLESEGHHEAAAESYRKAQQQQDLLNDLYPGSLYASDTILKNLDSFIASNESRKLSEEILLLENDLNACLNKRMIFQPREILNELREKMHFLQNRYPDSRYINQDLELKIKYLDYLFPKISQVQTRVLDNLLPLPQNSKIQMLRHEVDQELYRLVMNTNPSVQKESSHPVESITPREAEEFCRRLSWILGLPVALPSRQHYFNCLDSTSDRIANPEEMSMESQSRTHSAVMEGSPTEGGFYAVFSNISEITADIGREPGSRFVISGNIREPDGDQAAETMVSEMEENTRNRFTGFRIIIYSIEQKTR